MLILFVFWKLNSSNKLKFKISKPSPDIYLLIFLIFAALSIKNSDSVVLSAYQFLKLTEFVLFYFYIKTYALNKFKAIYSFFAIFCSGVLQALIGIIQFLRQSDLGLRYLGETALRPDMSGVAVFFNSLGEKVMRPYGVTPHPNILAAVLFVAVFSFYGWYLYKRDPLSSKSEKAVFGLYGITFFALLITFSRTVLFILFAGLSIRLFLFWRLKLYEKPKLKVKLKKIIITSIVVSVIFGFLYFPEAKSRFSLSSKEEAVTLRVYYNKESLKAGLNWTGVGIGNFVNWFMTNDPYQEKWFYQPAHNIYLLIYSEIGLPGLISFVLFLIFSIKKFILVTGMHKISEYSILVLFLSLLFIGFFDHFLWTLQQGRFLFWLTLALLSETYIKNVQSHA